MEDATEKGWRRLATSAAKGLTVLLVFLFRIFIRYDLHSNKGVTLESTQLFATFEHTLMLLIVSQMCHWKGFCQRSVCKS